MDGFQIPTINIQQTRSLIRDTIYVAASFSINKFPTLPIVTKLGDVDNGAHHPKLVLPQFQPSPEGADWEYVFSYLVINHGGDSKAKVEGACQNALLDYGLLSFDPTQAQPTGDGGLPQCLANTTLLTDDLYAKWNQLKAAFNGVSSNRCDGPVAIGKFSLFGSQLNVAAGLGLINMTHEGIVSAAGCGDGVSTYGVSWLLTAQI